VKRSDFVIGSGYVVEDNDLWANFGESRQLPLFPMGCCGSAVIYCGEGVEIWLGAPRLLLRLRVVSGRSLLVVDARIAVSLNSLSLHALLNRFSRLGFLSGRLRGVEC